MGSFLKRFPLGKKKKKKEREKKEEGAAWSRQERLSGIDFGEEVASRESDLFTLRDTFDASQNWELCLAGDAVKSGFGWIRLWRE